MLAKAHCLCRRTGGTLALLVLILFSCAPVGKVRGEVEPREASNAHKLARQNEEQKVEKVQEVAGNAAKDDGQENLPREKVHENQDAVNLPDAHMAMAVPAKKGVNLGFVHAFAASLSVIIVSELGDKTFFIAAIMAMRHARITVFVGALGALAVMTALSALLGYATTIIPRWFTYYASTFLFALFGLRMLREGWNMSADEGQEELEEVQADLKRRDEELERATAATVTQDPESGVVRGGRQRKVLGLFSPIFLQAFTLTFLAEWGDRSQITTIILAAREDVIGVTIGGILGHAICTALAVIGGRMIAQRISARTVTLVGGIVFIVFALSALFISPD
ncbi:transmembrane protein 165-like [Acanthaster planci]|uniref:GDT1 family protein n=1 Tax=Acanthaster planci TaxID=133434 RepID=A0A8B7ZAR5_ACAPL|nr:transmembrane protein 165-like [Acanthaster planci]